MSEQLKNIGDLMAALQSDIESIKSGAIEQKTGALVLRGRGQQVKLAEIVVQAARYSRKNGADLPLLAAGNPNEAHDPLLRS